MFSNKVNFRKPTSNTATMIHKFNRITLNTKGHPTVGHLTPKPLKRQPMVNQHLDKCVSLETTAETFSELIESITYHEEYGKSYTAQIKEWCEEVYKKLYDFVNRTMQPTFDEIDAMLLVCRILIQNRMKYRLAEFILNCPKKFLITYANNSERTPQVLDQLTRFGLENIRAYLIEFIHETKLGTWNERRNTHKRGNDLLQCTV